MRTLVACGVISGFLVLRRLAAHEDLQEQVLAISRRIQQQPSNPELYLKRGELYRALRDLDHALADYDQVSRLNPKLTVVDLVRGKLLLEAGRFSAAREVLDRLLARPGSRRRSRDTGAGGGQVRAASGCG